MTVFLQTAIPRAVENGMEAGDVTLMRSDSNGVAAAIALSRGAMRVMRQKEASES